MDPAPPKTPETPPYYFLKVGLAALGTVLLTMVPVWLTWGEPDGPKPKPTPSPTLVEVEAPGGQPITIAESGHTLAKNGDDNRLTYGFVLANGSEFVATNTRITFTGLDDKGKDIPSATWTQFIYRIAGGGKAALTGDFDTEGAYSTTVSIVDVRAVVGTTESWWRDSGDTDAKLATLIPSGVTVTTGQPKRPYSDVRLSDIRFDLPPGGESWLEREYEAVFRDASGKIVGGCSSRSLSHTALTKPGDDRPGISECFIPPAAADVPIEFFLNPSILTISGLHPSPGAS